MSLSHRFSLDTAYNAQREFKTTKDIQKKKLILAKVGANFLLSNGKLHVEGKQAFITFEKAMPQVRTLEERGEMEAERYGKPKKATLREMISLWSG